jgi:hypothetical protein
MTRKSALSAVMDQSASLRKTLGMADRAKLDEYFTSLRSLENRLAIQLEKPAPAQACKPAGDAPKDPPTGLDSVVLGKRHDLMVDLGVMALACNQTRVMNWLYAFTQMPRQGRRVMVNRVRIMRRRTKSQSIRRRAINPLRHGS